MDGTKIRALSGGVNQSGVRNHNERLLLSIVQRHGGLSGIDLARRMGLSPPAISTILRNLEQEGVLRRGEPVRGKVGKPSIPMELNPDGVLSVGLKVGRRSADALLLDLSGEVRAKKHLQYDYPLPENLFRFLAEGIADFRGNLDAAAQSRLCGIGIATPFELWKWNDLIGAPADKFRSWKDIVFADEIAKFSDLPVFVVNDATAACRAEHHYGRGKEFRDYAYFFIGSFIGGGIVMNNTVFEGNQGNAGALGSMRVAGPLGESRQLIDVASIHLLEARLVEVGLNPQALWREPQDWSGFARYVDAWIGQTAQELAKASLSVCSVVDFEAILIDGAFPAEIREELVERVRRYIANQDTRGLIAPQIEAGSIGRNAREIGAASSPIFSQFLLNANAGLSAL
ncbi:ROK family transcriptional regulator [Pseudosulfitobacter sp. DSM 107133]|uniref:ROK family transcriptional regulator n=1 Tax=Pseudosulfitobacter sp. DSM 107133 TaxID=2883100 RepID=UPI000DF468F3|nr:ROK family transcriptional regulator [Pseudosulfitobacter sp. DSM 107133]UOA28914.1 N-acetylglucosamine repressor [Pseudosulfitobacter sp. DSM 107133]